MDIVKQITNMITEDTDTIITESVLDQYRKFWSLIASKNPNIEHITNNQDIQELLKVYRGHENTLLRLAKENNLYAVEMELKEALGLNTNPTNHWINQEKQ